MKSKNSNQSVIQMQQLAEKSKTLNNNIRLAQQEIKELDFKFQDLEKQNLNHEISEEEFNTTKTQLLEKINQLQLKLEKYQEEMQSIQVQTINNIKFLLENFGKK